MLEDFVVPAAAQWLRSSLLGAYVDDFCSALVDLGHPAYTIRHKLWVVSGLSRWMAERHLAIIDLDERRVDEFLDDRRRRSLRHRGFRTTALLLVRQLRSAGVLLAQEPCVDPSPVAALLTRFETYLRYERALAECTIAAYLTFAHEFIVDRFDKLVGHLDRLHPGDVRDFLLARVRRMAPKRAQFMGTALRSFLRYLFVRGEIGTDLALAVPTVRQWWLSSVPRHISSRDVERLLRSCDLSSATGRRNHAILLLLARLGLRACEVLALDLGDLRWRDGEIVVRGKGLVRDRLPLPPDVGKAIALYLRRDRPSCGSRRVFLCSRAPRRGFGHPSTVSTIVARALAKAGVGAPMHGAHLLRHSLATAMVRQGASLVEVGQVLRHRSPNTTEIYAKLDFDALRDVAMPWPTARGAR